VQIGSAHFALVLGVVLLAGFGFLGGGRVGEGEALRAAQADGLERLAVPLLTLHRRPQQRQRQHQHVRAAPAVLRQTQQQPLQREHRRLVAVLQLLKVKLIYQESVFSNIFQKANFLRIIKFDLATQKFFLK
jgi:hypothetical protein